MKTLLKGVISVLIILGIIKTFQDHDILNEAGTTNKLKVAKLFKISLTLTSITLKI